MIALDNLSVTFGQLISYVFGAGLTHVPHGWRSTFSTAMNECHRADRDVIDLMLAHAPRNKVEAAYNRAEHLQRRRELAQAWANMLLD